MRNTFKKNVVEFIDQNPGLKRPEYIAAFVAMGMAESSASIYHFMYVVKGRKDSKSFKVRAKEFVMENPGLKRPEYITAFVEMGMTDNSASIYHFLYVTKPKKAAVKIKVQGRDSKGRFLKWAA